MVLGFPPFIGKKPLGPRPFLENIRFIVDLLIPNTSSWNVGLLNSIFTKPEVDEILKIKINIEEGENEMLWLIEIQDVHG